MGRIRVVPGLAVTPVLVTGLAVGLTFAGAQTPADAATAVSAPDTGSVAKPGSPAAGTRDLGVYGIATSPPITVNANSVARGTATCSAVSHVLGGGESNNDGGGRVVLTDSFPGDTFTWVVWVRNTDTASHTFTVYAVCGR